MKKMIMIVTFIGLCLTVISQRQMTRTGTIQFFSETDVEDIEAINNQVSSVLDLASGEMAYTLLMKAFSFEKALMQEHFNEKYVESDKYPKAKFKGKIIGFSPSKLTAKPTEFKVKGSLTIHGVTNEIEVTEKLWKNEKGEILGETTFTIKLADYKIEVPSTVRENISETIEIKVKVNYEKMG